jgi:hypothetical protein
VRRLLFSLAAVSLVLFAEKALCRGTTFALEASSLNSLAYQEMSVSRVELRSSGTGRFLSIDPEMDVDKNLYEPQRWNRYSYALNNPLKYTDPNGRSPVDTVNGFFNAFFSNFGGVRIGGGNRDYRIGQLNGDRAAAVSGFILATAGGTGAVVGSPTGVAIAAGGALATIGVAGMTNAAIHLSQNENPQGGSASGSGEHTPTTHPDEFDRVRGTSDAKVNKKTGEVWVRDRLHKDEWEVYRTRRDFERQREHVGGDRRHRAVRDDGTVKEIF